MRSAGRGGRCSCSASSWRSPAWCSRGSCSISSRRCSCGGSGPGSPLARGSRGRWWLIRPGCRGRRSRLLRLLHRSGERRPPAADGEHQRDQVHQRGGRGLQGEQGQGHQELDRVVGSVYAMSNMARRVRLGGCVHRSVGVDHHQPTSNSLRRKGLCLADTLLGPALRPGAVGVVVVVVVVGCGPSLLACSISLASFWGHRANTPEKG